MTSSVINIQKLKILKMDTFLITLVMKKDFRKKNHLRY